MDPPACGGRRRVEIDGRSAPVRSVCAESVCIETEFPVVLGEFACTENGAWYGQVQSHNGRIARILPLDLPEKIRPGELLSASRRAP